MSETVTLAGFAVIAAAAATLQTMALVGRRTLTFAEALRAITRRQIPRVLVLAGWLWLGWHLFSRAGAE